MSDTAEVTRYCLCGGALQGRSTPGALAEGVAALFDGQHSGPGHGPATAVQASRARRRDEASHG